MSRRTPYTSFGLNAEELAELARDGSEEPMKADGGGFQHFVIHLRACVDYETGVITLCDADIGRIVRYVAYADGDGGYESKLRKVFGRVLTALFLRPQLTFSFIEIVQ